MCGKDRSTGPRYFVAVSPHLGQGSSGGEFSRVEFPDQDRRGERSGQTRKRHDFVKLRVKRQRCNWQHPPLVHPFAKKGALTMEVMGWRYRVSRERDPADEDDGFEAFVIPLAYPVAVKKKYSSWEDCVAKWQMHSDTGSHSHSFDPIACASRGYPSRPM